MANIISERSFVTFRPAADEDDSGQPVLPSDYLLAREKAERAAAEACSSKPAQAAHRELAKLYASRRRKTP